MLVTRMGFTEAGFVYVASWPQLQKIFHMRVNDGALANEVHNILLECAWRDLSKSGVYSQHFRVRL
jgi:hypothetical protein